MRRSVAVLVSLLLGVILATVVLLRLDDATTPPTAGDRPPQVEATSPQRIDIGQTTVPPDSPTRRTAFVPDGDDPAGRTGSVEILLIAEDIAVGGLDGVQILCARGDSARPLGDWKIAGATDRNGALTLNGLDPGRLCIRPQCSSRGTWCTVQAGSTCQLHLVIPGITRVVGVALDPSGQPVPFAKIWLSDPGRSQSGGVAAETDGSGSFQLEFVGDGRFLASWADHVGRSAPTYVPPMPGEPVNVRLLMTDPVATLAGHVVDCEGAPIAGAKVLVGLERERGAPVIQLIEAGLATDPPLPPPPLACVTDAYGAYCTHAAATGDAVIIDVDSAGFSEWREARTISAEITNTIDIVLAREAIVTGVVRRADGTPCRHVEVLALPQATKAGTSPGQHCTTADARGHYRIPGLPGGPAIIKVESSEHGAAQILATLDVGMPNVVDLDLDPGQQLRFRAVDLDGRPLAGYPLRIFCRGTNERGRPRTDRRSATTGEHGDVLFARCLAGPYTVVMLTRDGLLPLQVASLEGVLPDASEHILRAALTVPNSWISGRCSVAGDGGHTSAVVSTGTEADGDTESRVVSIGEDWIIGPLYPGTYDLQVRAPGTEQVTIHGITVAEDATVQLGDIAGPGLGSLVLRFLAPQATADADVQVWLLRGSKVMRQAKSTMRGDSDLRIEGVPTGSYGVVAWRGREVMSGEVDIAAGADATLTLTATENHECRVRLHNAPQPVQKVKATWTRVGQGFLGEEIIEPMGDWETTAVGLRLPSGTYHLSFQGISSPALAEIFIDVPAAGEGIVDVQLLRRRIEELPGFNPHGAGATRTWK